MDYRSYDSSGTDDDLPPTHRVPRGGPITVNGRPALPPSFPKMYGEADMEAQIHQIEKEAYISLLRAFKAQADVITWEKEGLITELRKELRLSNEEHRELLARVNADDTIRRIREWRQSKGKRSGGHNGCQAVNDALPSPSVSASAKKLKPNQPLPSQSFAGPSPSFHPHQLSSSAAKRGSAPSAKGKKHKPALPGPSSTKSMPFYPLEQNPRGQVVNRVPTGAASSGEHLEGASPESLVGRRVRTRWPEDNTFYEAVITEYNPIEGLHALVYDIGTTSETWEWVNLLEISPEDIEWVGEDPGGGHRYGYNGPGAGLSRSTGPDGIIGRGRGLTKKSIRKDFMTSQNGAGKKTSWDIRIRHTDVLIREVERVMGSNHRNPREIERAKKVLEEQENALVGAIARLADVSDGETGTEHGYHHG